MGRVPLWDPSRPTAVVGSVFVLIATRKGGYGYRFSCDGAQAAAEVYKPGYIVEPGANSLLPSRPHPDAQPDYLLGTLAGLVVHSGGGTCPGFAYRRHCAHVEAVSSLLGVSSLLASWRDSQAEGLHASLRESFEPVLVLPSVGVLRSPVFPEALVRGEFSLNGR